MITAAMQEARLVLPGAAVNIFELMLSDLVVALTTMTYDDGRTWQLDALLPADEPTGMLDAAVTQAAEIAGIEAPVVEWRALEARDWVSETQKLMKPLNIGRFWVHAPDHREPPPVASLAIEVEAGLAFGTGRHATTAGCLLALEALAKRKQFRKVIDLGCGSGILAMAAGLLWPAVVWGSDIDPVAVATARDNARKNGFGSAIRFVTADGLTERRLGAAAPYDLIVANILAKPLVHLAPQIAGALTQGGSVVLSGLLVTQEALVLPAYLEQGLRLEARIRRDGWATLLLAG